MVTRHTFWTMTKQMTHMLFGGKAAQENGILGILVALVPQGQIFIQMWMQIVLIWLNLENGHITMEINGN